VAAQVDTLGIDRGLPGQVVGGGEHVVHFATGIVVASAQRRKHHDDPGFPKGAGSLVVLRSPSL